MSQLVCSDVTLGYDGHPVLEHLTFTVSAGDYLCIIGENGAGKSTLMKTLLGLHAPMSGQIEYGDGIKKNNIGYLPQQNDMQKDFPASVREVVISGRLNTCGLRPFYNKKDKVTALENMEKLGISELAGKCYRNLSGGQQQRVLLARALCAADKMILLDEPVAGLDPAATAGMYSLIHDINNSCGITVIMITHDVISSLDYATHILQISRLHPFFGTREQYLKFCGTLPGARTDG